MKPEAIDTTLPAPALSSGETADTVLKNILSAMECRTGTIHRFDTESDRLRLVSQVGIPEALLDKITEIPIGKGIAGAAAERREAVQLCNLQTDTSGVAEQNAKKTQVAGSLAVPILDSDQQLVGTLGVGLFTPHEFSGEETELLWTISRWLAEAFR